jgi:hypothetical protein
MSKHTPTPWRTGKFHMTSGSAADHVYSSQSKEPQEGIARCYGWVGEEEAQANADFIVRACNSHDELVEVVCDGAELISTIINGQVHPTDELQACLARYTAAAAKAEGK